MMRVVLGSVLVLLGVVFWQRPGAGNHAWPSAMPAFSRAQPTFSLEMKNGTSIVSIVSDESSEALLDSAMAAYRAAGWTESPVGTRDARLFVKGEAVAAIQAQRLPTGTCLTVIQRPRGL